jgi:hypothetical protein
MTDWAMVQWSRARQITQAMGIKEKDTKTPAPGVSPADYFSNLVAVNALQDAVGFLAHALPRYEAIVWGAKALSALIPASERDLDEARAFDLAHQWVDDPSEALRRKAEAMSLTLEDGPEKFLLMAIYFSGGSVSLEDLPPVHPPEECTAKLVAGAILLAAFATPDPAAGLLPVLRTGEKLAQRVS